MPLYVVKDLIPNETELISNWWDKKVNYYVELGYEIGRVDTLSQLIKGEKYINSKGDISTKN